MELSQPRPRGAQGSKPTHDFLSLYSPAQQDPTASIPGGYLKTHDFLQPLGQVRTEGNKVEHLLPGGMGTYSMSRISSSLLYMNQIQGQKVPKAEGIVTSGAQSSSSNNNDENSNCSSYTGSGFTINKGKTGRNGIGMPCMTSSARADTGNTDQKPNSPRSKHSATEQRRRSKINDRFSMLRGIIPHGDQKRDKASFLLEVIEYIQFLQEKVHKYEDSYHGWNNKPPKTIPLNKRPTDEPKLPMSISTNDKSKDEELIIESGKICISTMYSQGISNALTQALKTSGVDLSEANISVQIDLRKRPSTNLKDNETRSIEESGERSKRLKGMTNSVHLI